MGHVQTGETIILQFLPIYFYFIPSYFIRSLQRDIDKTHIGKPIVRLTREAFPPIILLY